ncbi:hypothetical protein PG989_015719 [Apiospora arundinis]
MPFFTPNVPAWFVDNCVKTASQLKEQHIRLVVRETKPDVKKVSDELPLSVTSPPSPTGCPQNCEVRDQDAGAHEQDTNSIAATQQEKCSPFAPWSTPHEQLSPSETVEPSDPYELDAALYQRLRDLVLPEDSEDDVTKSQHLATYPHIPKFARDLLHTIMTRSQVLRIITDGILFVLAVFLPVKFLQKCLLYMEMPRPWCFIHDGVVLRFERHGGGGQQFLNSVVGYFARDIGADLVVLNSTILGDLISQNRIFETSSSRAKWFAQVPGPESPGSYENQRFKLQRLFSSAMEAGRRSGNSQGFLNDSSLSPDLLVVLISYGTPAMLTIFDPQVIAALKYALDAAARRTQILVVVTDQHSPGELQIELQSQSKVPRPPGLEPDLTTLISFVNNPAWHVIGIAPLASKTQMIILDSSRTSQILRKGILSKDQIQFIARNIAPSITMERIDYSITAIMDGFDRQDEIIRQWKSIEDDVLAASKRPEEEGDTSDEEETATSLSDDKMGFSQKVRDAINKIEGDDDEFEQSFVTHTLGTRPYKLLAKIKDGWDDIALEPEVRTNILRIVSLNIEKPKAYGILKNAQIGGALLYGPPGTGKTHLARVLAKECNSTMIQVSSAMIEGCYVGETEKLIMALFNLGRMVSPSIIFINEAESIFRMRPRNGLSYDIRRVNQLLGESDNLLRADKSRPFLILATNYPTQLDHAVLRRIPGRIYLGPPSLKAREDLFRIYLRKEQIDSSLLPDLPSMTDNYSGSDLRTLCIHAATISQSEHESQGEVALRGKRVMRMIHFQEALKANSPTITRAAMIETERFASQFDRQSVERIRAYLWPVKQDFTNGPSKSNPDAEVNPAGNATELIQAVSGENQSIDIPSPPVIYYTEDDITANVALGPCTFNSPYRPLDQQRPEIRVLELIEPPTTSSMIHGRLRTVTLQPGLSFTALSYVWGDPGSNEDIILNEEPFRITKSLANALRWVKHHWLKYFPGRDDSEFCTWADAVCINQDDDAEKSFQIPLMGDIYGTAELVFSSIASEDRAISFALKAYGNIWKALTEGSTTHMSLNGLADQEWMERVPFLTESSSHDAQVDPEQTLDEKENCIHQEPSFPTPPGRNITEAEFLRRCKEQNVNPTFMAMRKMTVLPYWRRAWVVQEIVLGNNVLLFCDDTSLDFEVLSECKSILKMARHSVNWVAIKDHRCWQIPKGWCDVCWVDAADTYLTIIQSRQRLAGNRMEDGNFHDIVIDVHSNMELLATDPKDLVYGLLGLSKLNIKVDYSKTLGQVYGDYVRSCLEFPAYPCYEEQGLSHERPEHRYGFLLHAGIDAWAHDTTMPSWVPNFQMFEKLDKHIRLPRYFVHADVFSSDASESVEYPELILPGISLQRIVRKACIILDIQKTRKRQYEVDRGFLDHLRNLKLRDSNYVTGIPILQAVSRALLQEDRPLQNAVEGTMLVSMLALMNTVDHEETHRIFHAKFEQDFTNHKEEVHWFIQNLGFRPREGLFEEAANLDLGDPPKMVEKKRAASHEMLLL